MQTISNYRVTSRSSTAVVSLDDLKAQAKIQNDKEDDLITSYALSAERMIENYINASIVETTAESYLMCIPFDGLLQFANYSTYEINSILIKDPNDEEITLTAGTDYEFSSNYFLPLLRFKKQIRTNESLEAVKITFKAGQLQDELINQAIRGIVAQMYKYREDFNEDGFSMPQHFQNLLYPLRRWTFR